MQETSTSECVIGAVDIDPQYHHAILSRLFGHLARVTRDPIGDPARHGKSSRYAVDGRLSRAERLEIISHIATAGVNECSAWIASMLERRDMDEDRGWSDGDVEQRL